MTLMLSYILCVKTKAVLCKKSVNKVLGMNLHLLLPVLFEHKVYNSLLS